VVGRGTWIGRARQVAARLGVEWHGIRIGQAWQAGKGMAGHGWARIKESLGAASLGMAGHGKEYG